MVWGLVVVVAVALQWELHGEVEGSFTVTPSLLHSKCPPLQIFYIFFLKWFIYIFTIQHDLPGVI